MMQYIKDVRAEMRHVSWPSRRQTIMLTAVVILVSLATATYLGLWDYLFTAVVQQVI